MYSYWEKSSFQEPCDFTIIGGGIVGLTTAYFLSKRNPKAKISILEAGSQANGASTKNAGFACFGSAGELLSDLETMGEAECLNLVEKRIKGLRVLRSLLGDEALNYQACGGYELIRQDALDREHILNGLDGLNRILYPLLRENTFRFSDQLNAFKFKGFSEMIINPHEGSLNPMNMISHLENLVRSMGVRIWYGAKVNRLDQDSGTLEINDSIELKPKRVLVCVNGFGKHLLPELDIKPARAQVLVTKPISQLPFKGTFHFDQGYYYFRNIGNRVLFGGGRNLDVETETTTAHALNPKIQEVLEKVLKREILPETPIEIEHRWAGTMGVGPTKQYLLKALNDKVFVGMRLGGMGVALGSLVGKELAKLAS